LANLRGDIWPSDKEEKKREDVFRESRRVLWAV